jgi:hypothetical protein
MSVKIRQIIIKELKKKERTNLNHGWIGEIMEDMTQTERPGN